MKMPEEIQATVTELPRPKRPRMYALVGFDLKDKKWYGIHILAIDDAGLKEWLESYAKFWTGLAVVIIPGEE